MTNRRNGGRSGGKRKGCSRSARSLPRASAWLGCLVSLGFVAGAAADQGHSLPVALPQALAWSLSGSYGGAGMGALDIDVRPEKAEVYIDGSLVGVADNYDGFPAYLWLEEGTYDLVVYLEGYRTLARQVTIYPGLVIDVDNRLPEGESVLPKDLKSKETKNRDERLRRDHERANAHREHRSPGHGVWFDGEDDRSDREAAGVGRLHLSVAPGDAAIYLDGHFLGIAREVGGLSAGILVEPGMHRVEIVHPAYGSESIRIEIENGEEGRIEADLDRR